MFASRKHVHFLIWVLPLFFFFLQFSHAWWTICRTAKRWPGRKTCTFSIFVLCTALLILNPIIYYLNPSMEKKKKNLLKRSLCVYVNNTKKKVSTLEKDKKKKKVCDEKEHPSWCHGSLQQMTAEKSVPPQPSVLVALPFKLGVSLTEINVVFSALSIYLSSGCIDWKLNNEIVQK